jgi:hypothetical protein
MQLLDFTAARIKTPYYLSRDSAGNALAAWSPLTDSAGSVGYELRTAYYSAATQGWSGYEVVAANLTDGGLLNGGFVQPGGASLGPSGLGLAVWLGANGYHAAHLAVGSSAWTDDGPLVAGNQSALSATSPLAISAGEAAQFVYTTQCGDGGGQFGVQALGYHAGQWDSAATTLLTCGATGLWGLAGVTALADGGFVAGWASGSLGALSFSGASYSGGVWTVLGDQPVPGFDLGYTANCNVENNQPANVHVAPQIASYGQTAWMLVETDNGNDFANMSDGGADYLSSLATGSAAGGTAWGAPLQLWPIVPFLGRNVRISDSDQGPLSLVSPIDAGLGLFYWQFSTLPDDGGQPIPVNAFGYGTANISGLAVSAGSALVTTPNPSIFDLDGGMQTLGAGAWGNLPNIAFAPCGIEPIPLAGGAFLTVWSASDKYFVTLRYDPTGQLAAMPDTGGLAAGAGGFEPPPDAGLQSCVDSECQGVASECLSCSPGNYYCSFSPENLSCCDGAVCDAECFQCADNPDAGAWGCFSPFFDCCNGDTGISVFSLTPSPGAPGYFFPQDLCPNTWTCAQNCAPPEGSGPAYTICNPSSFGCYLTVPASGPNPAVNLRMPSYCNSSGNCPAVNDQDFECVICDFPPGPAEFLALCLPPGAGC